MKSGAGGRDGQSGDGPLTCPHDASSTPGSAGRGRAWAYAVEGSSTLARGNMATALHALRIARLGPSAPTCPCACRTGPGSPVIPGFSRRRGYAALTPPPPPPTPRSPPAEPTTFASKAVPRKVHERPEAARPMPPRRVGGASTSAEDAARAAGAEGMRQTPREEGFTGPSRPRMVYDRPKEARALPGLRSKVGLCACGSGCEGRAGGGGHADAVVPPAPRAHMQTLPWALSAQAHGASSSSTQPTRVSRPAWSDIPSRAGSTLTPPPCRNPGHRAPLLLAPPADHVPAAQRDAGRRGSRRADTLCAELVGCVDAPVRIGSTGTRGEEQRDS